MREATIRRFPLIRVLWQEGCFWHNTPVNRRVFCSYFMPRCLHCGFYIIAQLFKCTRQLKNPHNMRVFNVK